MLTAKYFTVSSMSLLCHDLCEKAKTFRPWKSLFYSCLLCLTIEESSTAEAKVKNQLKPYQRAMFSHYLLTSGLDLELEQSRVKEVI